MLDGHDKNTSQCRRGSTVYSQISLLSEFDAEKFWPAKRAPRQQKSNNSNENQNSQFGRDYYEFMRKNSIPVSTNTQALQEI